MAGNKKPHRVSGNRASAIERLDIGRHARKVKWSQDELTLIKLRNNLPMSHELNAHKIELTFGAIELYLSEQEVTGESQVNERGDPVVVDPVDGDLIPAGLAFKNQHIMFAALSKRFGWGEVPDGLRRMGAKLDAGMLLFDSDMRDARIALDWMREHIADVTPNQWSETLDTLEDRHG